MHSPRLTREQIDNAITTHVVVTHVPLDEILRRPLPDSVLAAFLRNPSIQADGQAILKIVTHRGAGSQTCMALLRMITSDTTVFTDEILAAILDRGCLSASADGRLSALISGILGHRSCGRYTHEVIHSILHEIRAFPPAMFPALRLHTGFGRVEAPRAAPAESRESLPHIRVTPPK